MKLNVCFLRIGILATIFLCICCSKENFTVDSDAVKNPKVTAYNVDRTILNICDLGDNASEYDEKIVRLRARMAFGVENNTFSDERCLHTAVVRFTNNVAYEPINKIREQSSRNKVTLFYSDIEVEGKFINKPFTQCCTKSPFQFEVTRTYTARPVKSK